MLFSYIWIYFDYPISWKGSLPFRMGSVLVLENQYKGIIIYSIKKDTKKTLQCISLFLLILFILLPPRQHLQMTRLGCQILFRFGRVSRRDFLIRLASVQLSSLPSCPVVQNRDQTDRHDAGTHTLVILRCLTREFFFGAIWRGPGFGPRAAGLHIFVNF